MQTLKNVQIMFNIWQYFQVQYYPYKSGNICIYFASALYLVTDFLL